MIDTLTAHKQELENELKERVQAFFEAYDETPESISVEMKLSSLESGEDISTIRILIKDALNSTTT